MRVAAIDIGTNSVLLLVAEAREGALVPVLERATITRLGQGVDAARALAPEAVERTIDCLTRYGALIRAAGVERLEVVGTSAMRDAAGAEVFRTRARYLLGVAPRVISGDEEAALTHAGALAGLELGGRVATVFDVGGGSTEIIRPATAAAPRGKRGSTRPASPGALRAVSLDVGSVRLTERHLHADPPGAEELAAVRADTRRALASATEVVGPAPRGSVLVGVAGTVTTLAAFVRGVVPYEGARVHGARLTAAEVARARAELAALPLEARRALRGIQPARADVIVAGAVIVEELLAWAGAEELVVSDRGVRWGLAARLAHTSTRAT